MVKPVVKVLHFILIIKNQVLIQLSYLLRKIEYSMGGEFVFFDKEKKEYKYTTYIPNRGVL